MRALVRVVLFLLVAASASAQEALPIERYRPLDVGDQWHYSYRTVSQGRTGSTNVTVYHDIEVVADTVIASDLRRIVVCRLLNDQYILRSVARYHIARTSSATLDAVLVRGSGCKLPLATVPPDAVYDPEDYTQVSNYVEEPDTISIGGIEYEVAGYRSRYYSLQNVGVSSRSSRESFAADVGADD